MPKEKLFFPIFVDGQCGKVATDCTRFTQKLTFYSNYFNWRKWPEVFPKCWFLNFFGKNFKKFKRNLLDEFIEKSCLVNNIFIHALIMYYYEIDMCILNSAIFIAFEHIWSKIVCIIWTFVGLFLLPLIYFPLLLLFSIRSKPYIWMTHHSTFQKKFWKKGMWYKSQWKRYQSSWRCGTK